MTPELLTCGLFFIFLAVMLNGSSPSEEKIMKRRGYLVAYTKMMELKTTTYLYYKPEEGYSSLTTYFK